jgi:hypothetical protein
MKHLHKISETSLDAAWGPPSVAEREQIKLLRTILVADLEGITEVELQSDYKLARCTNAHVHDIHSLL